MTGYLTDQLDDHARLVASTRALLPTVTEIGRHTCERLARGGTLYAFGNGGSAADAQHLVAELIGNYLRPRRPLRAVTLSVDPSVMTSISNDYGFTQAFSRQVTALAGPDDVVVGFTTSGRSPNVVAALGAARASGSMTVLFTGGDGTPARDVADCALVVPSDTTARVQEMHVLLLHLLSDYIDRWAAGVD